MRRAAALLACGMVLVLASGGLASSGNPDVQLLSASITFGGETCTIDNLPEVAVHWPGCEADEATASCAPTVFPGEVIRIAPEIVCLAAESPFNVRFSWRRQDAASDCGFLVLPFDPSDSPLEIQAEMNTTGLAPGCYVVTVWADSENVVFETDELNNRLVFSVRIDAPQPNLHPNALRVSTVSPIERGETFMLHAEVLNIGLADAGPFAVHFLSAPADSDIELCGGTLIQYVKDGAVQRWVDVIGADGSAACPLSPGQNPLGPWAHLGTVHVEGLARDDARLVSISVDTDEEELFPDENETYIVQVLVDPGLCTVEVLSALDDSTGDAVSQTEQVLPGGAVHESFESDNCLATSFRLDENWKRRPELRPISLHLTPPSPIEWRSSSIAAVTVENTGGSVPTSVMQLHFYYRSKGGSDAGWRRLETYEVGRPDERVAIELDSEPGIEQGRNTVSRSVRLHFDSDPGAYELKVLVDAEDDEREQNDDNNELSIGFTIIGSELHPRGLSMASRRISQGDSVAVSVDVENTGKKDVADFTVGFFVDGARMDTFYYFADDANRLAEGESAMVTGFIDTTDLPVGEHILRVVVDPDDRIPEIDEANNEISASLNIEPPMGRKPELQVEQVAIGSDSGSSSLAPAVIQATVINRGDLAAEGVSVDLLTCVDCVSCLSGGFDQAVGDSQSYWIDRLEPGQRHVATWQLTSPLPDEGRSICVVIDRADEIEEWDEGNNALILGYTPTEGVHPPGANLTCRIDSVRPSSSVDPGVAVTIDVSIINSGQESVGSFRVDFQWMDPYGAVHRLETKLVDSLSAGQSISIPYSVDTHHFPPGLHQAIVQVDVNDKVNEVNENDNQCNGTVQIGPRDGDCHADLVPVSVRFDSPGSTVGDDNTVERSQPVYVYVTVRNDGCIPSGPFAIAFETPLGVDIEEWTGIGAQDQIEVSYPVPTGTSGAFDLIIDVDPDNQVYEGTSDSNAERNNRIPNQYIPDLPVYNVAAVSPPRPEWIVPPDPDDSGIGWSDSPARWLAADTGTQHVYVVWEDGDIGRIRVDDDAASHVAQLAVAVTDVAMTFGSVPYAYVAAVDGSFQRVNLETGATTAEANLGGGILAIALGDGGRVYAAVENGFYELTLSAGSSYAVSRLVPVSGDVIDIQYESSRQLIYVLSTTGLHAYGVDLAARCLFDQGETVGAPATFTLGGSGNYLGTSAGGGAILYALSHCTTTGDGSGHILAGWRYPRAGSLPGAITSIVIDPRDIDPIYVATGTGSLYSLGFDGAPQWVYEAGAAIGSTPLADKRTGRIFFGDDGGIPHILTLGGVDAFEIDLTGYTAVAIRSTLVIAETRERTDFGTRLFRNYYYGREDGAVYKIASQQ